MTLAMSDTEGVVGLEEDVLVERDHAVPLCTALSISGTPRSVGAACRSPGHNSVSKPVISHESDWLQLPSQHRALASGSRGGAASSSGCTTEPLILKLCKNILKLGKLKCICKLQK